MKKVFIALLLTSVIVACDDDTMNIDTISGTYQGTFGRSHPNAKFESSEVTLTFRDNGFTGTSEKSRYPAICHGSFEVNGNTITFTDSCIWTADFDWSLILSGDFEASTNGKELILKRTFGKTTDTYRLIR